MEPNFSWNEDALVLSALQADIFDHFFTNGKMHSMRGVDKMRNINS